MHLSPKDIDKLTLHAAGFLAQKRLARGVRLNYPEAVALIAATLLELIRDGKSVAELMDIGRRMLGRGEVMAGVAEMIAEVQVEGTFRDGTKLVTVHHPIARDHGDLALALYGSFLPMPSPDAFAPPDVEAPIAGEILTKPGEIALNVGRDEIVLPVKKHGRSPDPGGEPFPVLGGERRARLRSRARDGQAPRHPGRNGCALRARRREDREARVHRPIRHHGLGLAGEERARLREDRGYGTQAPEVDMSHAMDRRHYADMYGPTTGDRVRLGDTGLVLEVERDFAAYGDECKFGGGKVLRDRMGQRAGSYDYEALDCLITNVLVVDWTGIYTGF